MAHQEGSFVPTRRGLLMLAAGAYMTGWRRLDAFASDFWNKKDPAEWSSTEIEQITTKSPWAKEVNAQYSDESGDQRGMGGPGGGGGGGRGGGGMGSPRIGGLGIPGMGGGGMGGGGMGGGRGRGRGGRSAPSLNGTVRWESAKPILEALKTPLPEAFADRYVISVSGFPLDSGRHQRSQEGTDGNSSQSTEDMLDRLKGLTYLEPKGREGAQPGIVQQQATAGAGSILFGFSKEMLTLKPEDKEVTFSTRLGGVTVKTKFSFKDMMYHGELAV
jgi:hypothetical protein